MKKILEQLFNLHMQNILPIKSQKDLGYTLLQYCQALINVFSIDYCGILLPDSSIFMDSLFVRE